MIDIAPAALRRCAAACLLVCPFTLAGCGEPVRAAGALHPVKGKFIFSKPDALSGLKVDFMPKIQDGARPASGDIGADGSFALKSEDGEGAHEGEYNIRLVKPGGFPKGKYNLPIPREYFDEDGAFLQASVKSDTTEIPPFELKPVVGKAAKGR